MSRRKVQFQPEPTGDVLAPRWGRQMALAGGGEVAGARSGLEALFVPDSVAVIGATARPGTVGRTVLSNLTENRFRSKMYAVNPQPFGGSRT
jgi:hypothetical protein